MSVRLFSDTENKQRSVFEGFDASEFLIIEPPGAVLEKKED